MIFSLPETFFLAMWQRKNGDNDSTFFIPTARSALRKPCDSYVYSEKKNIHAKTQSRKEKISITRN